MVLNNISCLSMSKLLRVYNAWAYFFILVIVLSQFSICTSVMTMVGTNSIQFDLHLARVGRVFILVVEMTLSPRTSIVRVVSFLTCNHLRLLQLQSIGSFQIISQLLSISSCFSSSSDLSIFSRGIIFLTTAGIVEVASFIVTLVMKTIVLLCILLRILPILVARAIVL